MIIIGEKINATRKAVAAAIAARDAGHILRLAAEQAAAGADYLDLNGGNPRSDVEVANMEWLVTVVQDHAEVPLAIDSANPAAIERGLALARKKPIVNSVSLEARRLEAFLPIISARECMVIALCMSDDGMPTGVEDRLDRAGRLIQHLTAAGKSIDEIIVDPCFLPIYEAGSGVCDAIAAIKAKYPGVHVGGGLSNASYGLPARRFINLAMVAAAVYRGMDAAIIDPTSPDMLPLILAGEVVSGADPMGMNYILAHRHGRF